MKGGLHFYRGSGAGAARYFDEGHRALEVHGLEVHGAAVEGAEAYYREHGRAAVEIDTWTAGERSGTTVLAESGDLVRWVEGIELTTGKVKGYIRAGGKDRQPLRFVETVVNNPKSLSIVASQNPVVAAAYDVLLARQADEIAKYLSVVAVTRIGSRGAQREVGRLVVETARVLHLTSREADPHRHIHLMLNTRVKAEDGTWRGLHSAAIRQHIAALNARGSRILVTDAELRSVLAAEGYSLGRDGEIDQARGAVELLSKRSAQVAANRDRIEVAWRREHPGQEPSQRVKNAWDRQAWAEGRRAKPNERETTDELSERVRVELAEAGFDFTPGAHPPVDDPQIECQQVELGRTVVSVGEVDRDEIARHAVAVLSAHTSAWGRAELTAAVEEAVTRSGVVGEIEEVSELVQECEARALACCSSVLDLTVQAPTAMSRHLTSRAVVDADTALNLGLAGLAGGKSSRDDKGTRIALEKGLDEGQAEAVGALCGTAGLEVVLGPAGSGKTATLAVARQRLEHQGRAMVLVAPTRKAAEVAGAEVGVTGASLAKLLYDNGWRWDELGHFARLVPGSLDPATGRVHHGPGEGSVLSGSSVVVVDEAGLVTVDQANALIDLVAGSGAALRLVGDPRQLGAIGRGGVMETASRWCGEPVTLGEVHRFLRVEIDGAGRPVTEADLDYAQLSLALREGSSPDEVVDQLMERGAVTVHPTRAVAVAAIAAEVADGAAKGPTTRGGAAQAGALAVTVATNDDAGALNEAVRELRIRAGVVDDTWVALGMAGVRMGAGDRIVTRRNDTARDVANREAWTVEAVTEDGAVLARSVGGPRFRQVLLEASYVAEAVQLGYASTDYGNQGVTTDRSLTWVTNATSAGGLYVGATRGRYANALHVVAEDPEDARTQLVAAAGRDRADRGLDAARVLAEVEAVPVATAGPVATALPATGAGRPASGTERPLTARTFDPDDWQSAAELDARAEAIEARLAKGLRALREVPVMADDVREELNRADRLVSEAAREKAAWHRAEADRIAAGRDELVATATADYFAAREDSRIIEAGPGRFHHRAAKVEAARARRDEAARRWSQPQLPGSRWTDTAVRDAASRAADQIVAPAVQHHCTEADRAERTAAARDAMAATRDAEHETVITTNERRSTRREALIAGADRDRAAASESRKRRDELVETMTPEDVATADRGRDAHLADQDRELRLARQYERSRRDHEHLQVPTIGAGGPAIEA